MITVKPGVVSRVKPWLSHWVHWKRDFVNLLGFVSDKSYLSKAVWVFRPAVSIIAIEEKVGLKTRPKMDRQP